MSAILHFSGANQKCKKSINLPIKMKGKKYLFFPNPDNQLFSTRILSVYSVALVTYES